jgi:hypothetical protein
MLFAEAAEDPVEIPLLKRDDHGKRKPVQTQMLARAKNPPTSVPTTFVVLVGAFGGEAVSGECWVSAELGK